MEGKILFINCHGFKPVAIDKKIGMTAGQVFFLKYETCAPKNKKNPFSFNTKRIFLNIKISVFVIKV